MRSSLPVIISDPWASAPLILQIAHYSGSIASRAGTDRLAKNWGTSVTIPKRKGEPSRYMSLRDDAL